MMNCPKCGGFMVYSGTFAQGVFSCSVCHHSAFGSPGFSYYTTANPGLLSGGLGEVTRNWEDPPARTPVPLGIQNSFSDGEVLEP